MKLIVIISLFIVGVTSEQPEVTSASTPVKNEKISTSLKTKPAEHPANRRDGISYSSSVIHHDPNHPEQNAASSIDFRLNTGHDSHKQTPSASYYTTPKYDFSSILHAHSGDYKVSGAGQRQPEESHQVHTQENEDVIYGKNTGLATSGFQFERGHQGLQPVPQRGHDSSPQGSQSSHPHSNHHSFYKQLYAQPAMTETKHKVDAQHPTTQFKHGSSAGRVLSTPRPKSTSPYRSGPTRLPHHGHSSHSSHSAHNHGSHSHQTVHKLPVPQAYTQAIHHNPEDSAKSGKSISFSHHSQNHGQNDASGQTQSFNVGYSVKFGNEGSQGQKRKPFKVNRPDSDIITGSYKEEVSKPSHLSHLTQHRFLGSAHDDPKQYSASSNSPQQILSQANLTPKTQKQLAFLENIQSHKFVQKEPIQSNFPWKNLSPSVEIYKSKEISLPGSAVTKNYAFDHEKAIGKSEGFDYTNAVDFNGNIVKVLPLQGQSGTQHKGYIPLSGLNHVAGAQETETQQVQVQAQIELQPHSQSPVSFIQMTDSGLGSKSSPIDKIPALPKLPIDTSLIREPFLTVHKDRMHPHGAQLPIHFDTSLIKDVGQAYGQIFNEEPSISSALNSASVSGSTYQENLAQINNLLAEQSQQHNSYQQLLPNAVAPHLESAVQNAHSQQYQQQMNNPVLLLQPAPTTHISQNLPNSQSSLDDMTFSYPQNGLFNPIMAMVSKPQDPTSMPALFTPQGQVKAIDSQVLKHLKMYKVNEHVPDHAQPQQMKFKVFGKPGNSYMRHQYEKMRHGAALRVQGMQNGNKRQVRDYTNIEMDLRPPPMAIPFKTSNFLRIKQ